MAVEQVTYKNIDPKVRTMIMVGLILAMLAACFDGSSSKCVELINL